MASYNPHERIHNLAWIIFHSKNLREWSKEKQDSSLVIYCCLELRNALEILELNLMLSSVEEDIRLELVEKSKPKNGIDRVNDKIKSLKQKYQDFYTAVCEVVDLDGVFFDYKKSGTLKYNLSQYIHTYTRDESEMIFTAEFIQQAYPLIDEVITFLEATLMCDGENYTIQNLGIDSLPPEGKILLDQWKTDVIKSIDELKERITKSLRN